jgi:hypothetical protein
MENAAMRQRKTVDTTLGDLIVAVTDQIALYVRDPTAVYLVVECILSDLVVRERLRFHSRPRRRLRMYH